MKRIRQFGKKRRTIAKPPLLQLGLALGGLPRPDWREMARGTFVVTAVLAPQWVGAGSYAQAVSIGNVELLGGFSIVLVAVFAEAASCTLSRMAAVTLWICGCLAYCLSIAEDILPHGSLALSASLAWMLWSRVRSPAGVPAWSRTHYLMVAEVCMASWVALFGFIAVAWGLASLAAFVSPLKSGALALPPAPAVERLRPQERGR